MKAAALFLVLAVAKLFAIWERPVAGGWWFPVIYLWQDLAVALLFLAFERAVRRPPVSTTVYWMIVVYAAVNVAVIRVLSTPITVAMLHATSGTLGDSIGHHVTKTNLLLVAFVIVAAIFFAKRTKDVRLPWQGVAAAAVVAVAGAIVAPRHDTRGMERNALLALARTALPRLPGGEKSTQDWRASPFPAGSNGATQASTIRGVAAGRNVLLVILESTGAQYLRPYGAPIDPMPTLSRLADSALVMRDAYSVYPESIKGLLSTLSSRYPAFDVSPSDHAPAMQPSLATVLGARGYATALFHPGRFMYLGMDTIVAAAGFQRAEDAGDIGGNRNSSFGIDEPATVARILEWIDSLPKGKPFFVTYLPIAGHHPYVYSIAPRFPGTRDIDSYYNSLAEADEALRTLIDGLRQRGLVDHTLIALAGDHGEAFLQHPGNVGHTLAIYDENVRVPLVISAPGVAGNDPMRRGVASLVDLAPTILDLVGVDRPREFDGSSLLDPGARMSLFFTDYSLGLLGLRDGCWKYIHEVESGRSHLFDVCVDPGERADLSQANGDRVAEYRSRLRGWSSAQVRRMKQH